MTSKEAESENKEDQATDNSAKDLQDEKNNNDDSTKDGEHSQINLPNLPKSAVVNVNTNYTQNVQNDLINDAIAKHLMQELSSSNDNLSLGKHLKEIDPNKRVEISSHEDKASSNPDADPEKIQHDLAPEALQADNDNKGDDTSKDSDKESGALENNDEKEQDNSTDLIGDDLSANDENGKSRENNDSSSETQQDKEIIDIASEGSSSADPAQDDSGVDNSTDQGEQSDDDSGGISDNQVTNDMSSTKLLEEKLNQIIPKHNIAEEAANLAADIINNITKKLYLMVPTDFNQILKRELFNKVAKFYHEGKIKVKLHSDKYEEFTQAIDADDLFAKFKDNFEITKDDSLGKSDVSLQHEDTYFEYSQEQVISEIEELMKTLIPKTE